MDGAPFRSGRRATGSRSCPACSGTLLDRQLGGTPVGECPSCLGIWLAPREFNELWMDLAAQRRLLEALPAQEPGLPQGSDCACPTCRKPMTRRELGGASGVVVDTCKRHGIWFDRGELRQALQFLLDPPLDAPSEPDHAAIEARRRREMIDTLLDHDERKPRWYRWLGALFDALTGPVR